MRAALLLILPLLMSAGGKVNPVRSALRSGQPVVIIVAPVMAKAPADDEAYGDWAHYLNQFAAESGKNIRIVKLTPRGFAAAVRQPVLNQQYATIFLRDNTQALVYEGMILEPEVYIVARKWMLGEPSTAAMNAQGLHTAGIQFR